MAAVCQPEFGISRQTGYKWWRRYLEGPGTETLVEHDRRPHSNPRQIDDSVGDLVAAARGRYPHWGARTLYHWLRAQFPKKPWPSPASIGRLLARRGLLRPIRRRRKTPPYTQPFAEITAPNQLWCIDFKGHFCTADGTRIYPLTITDSYSRFVLRCDSVLDPRSAEVRLILEGCFREFGLPEAIRSDNGPPFASTGPGGVSFLSAWWISLGIRHERIEPGKAAAKRPPRAHASHAQARHRVASGSDPSWTARPLRSLAQDVQQGTPSPGHRLRHSCEPVCAIGEAISRQARPRLLPVCFRARRRR